MNASGRSGSARLGCVLTACAAIASIAGTVSRARADDDDQKLRDKKPAVLGRVTSPDPWKLASSHQIGAGDASFTYKNVNLKTWMPLNTFTGFTSGDSGADCWGYTSPSGREYALMGLSWGNGIVEVTDPSSPTLVTVVPGGVNQLWRDITVVGTYAYAVSDNGGIGIQVMNLANVDVGVVPPVVNISQGGHTTTHTILSNPSSGYLYLCGGNALGGGVIPASTTNPLNPTFTGPGWANPSNPTAPYVHEAQILTYTSAPYAGKEIAFLFAAGPYYGSAYNTGLSIVDFTNKAAPVTMSSVWYPGLRFCHQGWVTDDRKYLYIDDELDAPTAGNGNVPRGLSRIFDVSDLSVPRMVSLSTNGVASVDHNQYVRGRYLYQSNYTSGLRIWDISNPLKPYEVAWFDTRPEDDGTGYNGAWGNYPYFNSGTVLISDLERGLFLTKMSILEFDNTYVYPTTLAPGAGVPVTAKVTAFDSTIGPVSVFASVNGGAYVSYPMTDQGGGVYAGNLPATSGFDRVRYYFRADTSEVTPRTFTWPLNAAGGDVFTAYAQSSQTTVFADNFQTDLGWTVQNTGITAGAWARATPLYNGGAGAVVGDADGSGMCFVTGNTTTTVNGRLNPVSVTGGTTRLLSPAFDLSAAPEARMVYSRWFVSCIGTVDSLVTEVSNNNGTSWTPVETLTPASGGWAAKTIRVADYVAPSAQMRIRFSIANTDSSVSEGGLDAFSIVKPAVAAACYADCDGVGGLTGNDFQCFLDKFVANASYADCDGVGGLTANDFQCFLDKFVAGCS